MYCIGLDVQKRRISYGVKDSGGLPEPTLVPDGANEN